MTARKLILWRHGQTEWNLTGRFQGQADIPLNELGLQQARDAAPAVAGYQPTRVIASDLERAQQTAAELSALTGVSVESNSRFREIHVAEWEGLRLDEVLERDPEFLKREIDGRDSRRGETGESTAEVGERIAAAMHDVTEASADDDVVVVAMHGLAIRVGVATFLGLDLKASRIFGGVDNCGWVVLDRSRSGAWRLSGYNVLADPHAVSAAQTRELSLAAQ